MAEDSLEMVCAAWLLEHHNHILTHQNSSDSEDNPLDIICTNFMLGNVNLENETIFTEIYSSSMESMVHWIVLFIYFLFFIVFIVGLIGNCLVIYVVARFRKMHTITNIFLANLAVADASFILCIPFLLASTFLSYWPFGSVLCRIYIPIFHLNLFATSAFLVVIAIDRFLVICHPSKAQHYRTLRNAVFLTILTWCVSGILVGPSVYATTITEFHGKTYCFLSFDLESETSQEIVHSIYMAYSTAVGFVIPLVFLAVLYALIIQRLKTIVQQQNREKSTTRLLITVVIVYFVCWAPIRTLETLAQFVPSIQWHILSIPMFQFSTLLAFVNSAVNPILYAFLSESFRKSFREACCCAKSQTSNTENSRSSTSHHVGQTTVFLTSAL